MPTSRERGLSNDAGDVRVLRKAAASSARVAVVQLGLAEAWWSALAKHALAGRDVRTSRPQRVATSTWAAYRRTLRLWLHYLDDVAACDDPGHATVRAYLAWLRRTRPRLAVATLNNRLDAIQAFYRWTAAAGLFPDIAAAIPAATDPRSAPRAVLDAAGVRRLVARLGGRDERAARDRALVWTLFGGALETISLQRADVADFDAIAGTLRHRPRGHRRADVVTPLPAPARAALSRYLAVRQARAHEPLFTASRRHAAPRLSTLSMRLTVRRCLDAEQAARPPRRGESVRRMPPSVLRVSGLCHRLGLPRAASPPASAPLRRALQEVGYRSLRAARNLIRRCRPAGGD